MRMLLKVTMPVEATNRAITSGKLASTVEGAIERLSPEAVYFVAEGGKRTGYFFFDLKNPSDIPAVAEPFFLGLDAGLELTPAMNIEDLRAGLAKAFGDTTKR